MKIFGERFSKLLLNSGDVFLPSRVISVLNTFLYNTPNNSFYINGWSILHLFSGILLGLLYLFLGKEDALFYFHLFILHTIWELWQVFIGMAKPWRRTGDSNIIDSVVDTGMFMMGAYVALSVYNTVSVFEPLSVFITSIL
jgi:VanZ family protein